MSRNVLFSVLLVAIANIAVGQAKIFEPGLISDNQAFGLTISPNGKELLFVKSYGGRDTLQIYQSSKINGVWQKPVLAFFADPNYKQIDPAFSPDGKTILFNSLTSAQYSFDIYALHQTDTGWTKPFRLSDSINTELSDFYATISNNKNIYFTRRTKSNDIYVSHFKDGHYQKAIPLDKTITYTDFSESNPYISPQEDFIIFFSDLKAGIVGNDLYILNDGFGESDLYISFSKKGKWSHPINLGEKVNSKIGEFCPSIDYATKAFLFSRTEVIENKRVENIYTIPLKELGLKRLKRSAKWDRTNE